MDKNNIPVYERTVAVHAPELLKEWDYRKNTDITPEEVTYGSERKVYWICQKNSKHQWMASVNKRVNGRGCPYCAGRKVLPDEHLLVTHPDLAKEWDYEKNDNLKPENFYFNSKEIVHWKCVKNPKHQWETKISYRTQGSGCPYCAGQKVLPEESIAATHPHLLQEWDYELNKKGPEEFSHGSGKKVHWICSKNPKHKWEASIHRRSQGKGCPYCYGQKFLEEESLMYTHPQLLKEWDFSKNKVKPNEVSYGSHKRIHWVCSKNPKHQWEACVYSRINTGCPYCSGRKVLKEESIVVTHPHLIEEWDYKKNKNLQPEEFSYGSNKKVHWICKCCKHEWVATISKRTEGTGCPKCAKQFQISFPETAILYYLQKYFPHVSKGKITNTLYELDIYIPSIQLAIEYDGERFHQDIKRDFSKDEALYQKMPDVKLIRVREPNCPQYQSPNPNTCFIYSNGTTSNGINETIYKILKQIEILTGKVIQLEVNVEKDRFEILDLMNLNKMNNSLEAKFPEIAKEWHPTKNGNLKPNQVTAHTHLKVYWQCKHGYEWKCKISGRTRGQIGCPKCRAEKKYSEVIPQIQTMLDSNLTKKQISEKTNVSLIVIRNLGKLGLIQL